MRRGVVLLAALFVPTVALSIDLRSWWAAACPGCPVMRAYLADPAAFPALRIVDHAVKLSGEGSCPAAAVPTEPD